MDCYLELALIRLKMLALAIESWRLLLFVPFVHWIASQHLGVVIAEKAAAAVAAVRFCWLLRAIVGQDATIAADCRLLAAPHLTALGRASHLRSWYLCAHLKLLATGPPVAVLWHRQKVVDAVFGLHCSIHLHQMNPG